MFGAFYHTLYEKIYDDFHQIVQWFGMMFRGWNQREIIHFIRKMLVQISKVLLFLKH